MVIDVVDQIAAAVGSREPVNGVRIVGLDGPSGSGKSHLARRAPAVSSAAPIISSGVRS